MEEGPWGESQQSRQVELASFASPEKGIGSSGFSIPSSLPLQIECTRVESVHE